MSMSLAATIPSAPLRTSGARFCRTDRLETALRALASDKYVIARADEDGLTDGLRGRVDHAIEAALARRGALPPAVEIDAPLAATISDQLFRARALGANGLAIALPRMNAFGAIVGGEDGEALLQWLAAADRAPIALVFDEEDLTANVLAPVPLGRLTNTPEPEAIIAPLPRASSVETAPSSVEPQSGERDTLPFLEMLGLSDEPAKPVMEPAQSIEKAIQQSAAAAAGNSLNTNSSKQEAPRGRLRPKSRAPMMRPMTLEPEESASEGDATPVDPAVLGGAPIIAEPVVFESEPPPPPPAPRRIEERVSSAVNAAEWRNHAIELDKARGPKPVSTIEKLFATRYLPLIGAAARGEIDGAVRSVIDAWRSSFEHSYRDAYAAIRVTQKRPHMVFDAPEIAAKLGRLNGARAVKILLVDAMRFDLGERVASLLAERMTGRGVLVERNVLWAAIPTTTPPQLALLGRGAEGLKDEPPASDPEIEIARGRAVGIVRRERCGSRELFKLDLVEARLRGAGRPFDERLDAIALEVTDAIDRFATGLPPRTLLYVFGDHGFRLPLVPGESRSTGPATQGGLSPEEVLVPGHAWLVGGVH
jgi:hypothetical protein